RGTRPERSDPARLDDPAGSSGRHRGPPGQGAQIAVVSENPAALARQKVEAVYRSDSRRVLATLIRLLGDFDLAEEALHDACRAAVEQWPREGVPANPRAWLVSTGRFKAIDTLRRRRASTPRWESSPSAWRPWLAMLLLPIRRSSKMI